MRGYIMKKKVLISMLIPMFFVVSALPVHTARENESASSLQMLLEASSKLQEDILKFRGNLPEDFQEKVLKHRRNVADIIQKFLKRQQRQLLVAQLLEVQEKKRRLQTQIAQQRESEAKERFFREGQNQSETITRQQELINFLRIDNNQIQIALQGEVEEKERLFREGQNQSEIITRQQESIESLKGDNGQKTGEISYWRESFSQSYSQKKKLAGEVEKLKQSVSRLERENRSDSEKLADEVEKLKRSVSRLERKNLEEKQNAQRLQRLVNSRRDSSELQRLEAEVERLSNRNDALEEDIIAARNSNVEVFEID